MIIEYLKGTKMKSKYLGLVLIIWLGACCPNKALFVEAVSDHRAITVETVDALLVSIDADLKDRETTMTPDEVQAVNNLIDRLRFMKQGSVAIEKYAMQQADGETLAKVLRNKLK